LLFRVALTMIDFSVLPWSGYGLVAAAIIAAFVLAELLLAVFDKLLRSLVSRTQTKLDDMLFEASRGSVRLLFVVLAVYLAVGQFLGDPVAFGHPLDFYLLVGVIVAAAHFIASLVNAFLKWSIHEKGYRKDKTAFFPLFRKLVLLFIYVLAFTIILTLFGIEIGPVLASLGIAGLAVALALQSTLSNFFAGVYILVDKPVKVGDYVSIDSESSGVTGFVKEIGWRNTKIQSFGNTVFVLPNDKVANSTIINYSSAKDKGRGVLFDVGVDYSSDADKVERLLREAVKEAAKKNEQIVKDFEPVVRFENFGDSALYFKVIFRVQDYTARWSAEAQVKRRILDLFRKNKVSVPFPIRTVYLKK